MQHLPAGIDKEDVKLCFVMNDVFSTLNNGNKADCGKGTDFPTGAMDFDLFKKMFFNHLYIV